MRTALSRGTHCALANSLIGIIALGAHGQETLPEITVWATKVPAAQTAETAARARDRVRRETAGGAGVVDAADLQKRSLDKMEDALRGQPGLAVETQFTGTSQARFVKRGSGAAGTPPTRGVRMLVDDMPMTLPDGHFLPQNIDTRALDHIDVYRGAASITRNIGSLGGAINFATPTGRSATGWTSTSPTRGANATSTTTPSISRMRSRRSPRTCLPQT